MKRSFAGSVARTAGAHEVARRVFRSDHWALVLNTTSTQ
jgi:hypothetical protein